MDRAIMGRVGEELMMGYDYSVIKNGYIPARS